MGGQESGAERGRTPAAREIMEVALYAEDLAAAERFYAGVMGLERIASVAGRHVFFRCGARVLLIFHPAATARGGSVPPHGARGPGHVAFAARPGELERWRQHLADSGVPVEMDHEWPEGGRSLYFRDPAGNSLEIVTPGVWRIAEADVFGS